MTEICVHCFVSGHVQGVFFRRGARDQGKARGLKGWVRNLEDGRLELMICGEEAKVSNMLEWLWQGPEAAQVEDVQHQKIAWQEFSDFEVRY